MRKRKSGIGKKIFSLCFAAMMLVSVGGTISLANDHTDEGFSFSFPAGQTTMRRTRAREKEDASSMYIKCYTGDMKFEVWGFGYSDRKGNVDCPYKGPHYAAVGLPKYFPTLVKENGFDYGGIVAYNSNSAYPYSWSSTGVWSPDSIGG